MERLIVYPKTVEQKTLLQALLQEMNISFESGAGKEETLLSEEEFYAKIDASARQEAAGLSQRLTVNKQAEFLDL